MNDSYEQASMWRRSRVIPSWLIYAGIFAAYAALRLSLFQPTRNDIWTDTQDYLRMARWPLLSLSFWAGARPVGTLLIYKLLGADIQRIIYFQVLLALSCWGLLGLAVARSIRTPWLRWIALSCVLLFSFSSDIAQWDFIVLSESITGSLFALLIGLGLWTLGVLRGSATPVRKRLMLGLLIAVAALWSLMRDANAYFVLGLAGLLALGLLFRSVRGHPAVRQYLVLIAALVAIFVVQDRSANVYGRWRYPLIDVIGKRILVDDERTAFFAAHGMPIDGKVMRYRGKYGEAYGNAIFRDPDMEYFRQWMTERGKLTYMLFLLSHPREALAEPLNNLNVLLRPPVGYFGEKAGVSFPPWVLQLSTAIYPRPIALLLALVGALALLATALTARGRARPEWAIPAILLLLAYPMILVVWHGDSMDVGRHSYLNAVQIRLAGWLLLLFVADALLLKRHKANVL
jgi:hypothetical protein